MIRPATPLDIALLIFLAAIYGSAFSAIKIAVPAIGPFGLVLARVLIGFAVLLPYALARGWVWPQTGRTWRLLLVLLAFNLIVPFFLVSWAQLHLNASLMALIMGAGPFFGLMVSHLATLDDRFSTRKLVGVGFGFAGLVVVLGIDALTGFSGESIAVRLAQGAALLASACYAASGVMVRRIDDVPPHQLASLVLGSSCLVMLAATPILMPDAVELFATLDRPVLLAIAYLGAVATGGAYILRYHLIRTVGMSYFGLSIYLVPVFGMAAGAVMLSEPVPLSMIAGLMLILIGLAVARRSPRTNDTDKPV